MWSMIVLGSAQDGGLPQFGARTPLDQAARSGSIPRRYSSCVALVADDGRSLLLDIGPDVKAHEEVLLGHPAMEQRTERGSIDGVVITHAHIGHYAGLIHLGREVHAADAVPCWVTSAMGRFLRAEAPWRLAIEQGHIALNEIEPPASFSPWADLEITLIPVPHRHEASDTVAISVNGSVLYLPDIDSWEDWPVADEVITGHSTVLLDATFWSVDELPHRDIKEIKHPLVPDTLQRFGHLVGGTRLILTHLNHTNPVCDPESVEHAAVIDAGFEVALEGLTFGL
jgi:pyrroloquinoline quinone biosynthesis protein B